MIEVKSKQRVITKQDMANLLHVLARLQSTLSKPNLDVCGPEVERVIRFFKPVCNEAELQLLAADRADGGDGTTGPSTAEGDRETPKLGQEAETGPQDTSQQMEKPLDSSLVLVQKIPEPSQSRQRPRRKPIPVNVSCWADACQRQLGGPLLVGTIAPREQLQDLAPKEWKEAVDAHYDVHTNFLERGPDNMVRLADDQRYVRADSQH